MGVLAYWVITPLAIVAYIALVLCVFSAAEECGHIAEDTLYGEDC